MHPSEMADLGTESITPFSFKLHNLLGSVNYPNPENSPQRAISSVGNTHHGTTDFFSFFPVYRRSQPRIFFNRQFIMNIVSGFSLAGALF